LDPASPEHERDDVDCVAGSGEIDEGRRALRVRLPGPGNLERESGLSDSGGAYQRDNVPPCVDETRELANLTLSADERRRGSRK
jgi:hypothetical protein